MFFFEPSRPSTPQHPSSPKHSDALFTQDHHHNSTDDTDGDGEDDSDDDKWTTAGSPVDERKGRHGEMLGAVQAKPEESYGSERFISLVVLTLVLALFIKWI